MKIKSRLLFFALIVLCAGVSFAEEEKLVVDKNEVKVYLSKDDGAKIKRFRGVTRVDASLTSLIALLHDLDSAPDWIHAVSSAEKIEPFSGNDKSYMSYITVNAPWPTKDRDSVVFNVTEQDPVSKVVTLRMQSKPTHLPAKNKYVRIPKFVGYWKLKPISTGKVEVTFSVLSDPGGNVPLFLYNTMITDTPYKTLINLRAMMPLGRRYVEKQYSYIKDV